MSLVLFWRTKSKALRCNFSQKEKIMHSFVRLICALVMLGSASLLSAQVPQLINYQGRVAVGAVNFNGNGQFKFALVSEAGTSTYWSNDGTSTAGSEPAAAVTLTVIKGLYSVLLGDTSLTNMTTVPASVFANTHVLLRVWFNDGVNGSQLLTPDQRLAAVGHAMVAGTLQSGAIISTSGNTPAASLANASDKPVALSFVAPFRTWWIGQNQAPDANTTYDNFYIYDQNVNATRLRIDTNGVIHGNGAGLSNVPSTSPAITLVDGSGATIGRVITSDRFGASVLTSTGHQIYIPYDGVFQPAQIYYTGTNGTGTAYLNDGGSGTSGEIDKLSGKWVVFSGSFASLMEPDTVVDGTEVNSTFTGQSIDNPTNSNFAAAPRSGWKLKTTTRAAIGLPATFALPISLQ